MILKTMWGKRVSEPNAPPELMEAWDEHGVDGFPEGFEKSCAFTRASWGEDLAEWRMVDIHISDEAIRQAFKAAATAGSVLPGDE